MSYHDPVLLTQSVDALIGDVGGIYIDATFGGGGHSRAILKRLDSNGKLLGFDQDEDALANIPQDDRFLFVGNNFRYLKRYLRLHGIKTVDGILADLGVSSHQLNKAERGFSYRFDADLDMRMNQQGQLTARDILNTYTIEELQSLFSEYGEVRNSKTLAKAIVAERSLSKFKTINDFLRLLEPIVMGKPPRYFAQVFQALRIEVNDEMGALKAFFEASLEVLKPSGKLVIISYHSLEDRLTKNFFKNGNFEGKHQKDFYGNIYRPFKIITKKAIEPSKEEVQKNSRARSAKMRVAEKV